MIRIAGGKWKGQFLKVPEGRNTRPTSSSRRETLFNILEHGLGHFPEKVLDLFAGTGALGIEALSHSAHRAVFVEKDSKALEILQKNFELLQLSPQDVAVVTTHKFREWPLQLKKLGSFLPFDTIFCDPPYGLSLIEKVIPALEKFPELFSPQSILVIEMEAQAEIPNFSLWHFFKERKIGEGRLVFFSRQK
jgi:16S rRNA (guanine966-N2)-methyltransferase